MTEFNAVLQIPDRSLQSPGTDLLRYVDQDGLRLNLELGAELARCLGNQDRVPIADVAVGQGLIGLRQRRQPARDRDALRRRRGRQVQLPAQPCLSAQRTGWRITLPAVEAPEPAQSLGLGAVDDALERDLVRAHRLRGQRAEVLCSQAIEQRIELSNDLSRGPTHPFPTLRTHVRIVSKLCSVSSISAR